VASLLEVGTGFHPELTGRENIFLNGAILGMTKAEIKKKFDEIVAFAEVERFLDTPVKRYSSGMYVRLAFAVAAHLEPEILVVDEVLAVGDAEFQKKCLGKMKDVATGGRTVLFVSHNMGAVQSLCSHGIVLHEGKVVFQGAAADAARQYREKSSRNTYSYICDPRNSAPNRVLSMKDFQEGDTETLDVKKPLLIEVTYRKEQSKKVVAGLHIHNEDDAMVIHSSPEISEKEEGLMEAQTVRIQASIPANMLNVGKYFCTVILAERNKTIYESLEKKVSFLVDDPHFKIAATNATDWKGILSPRCIPWKIKPT
jgi:lipopolysaccharide transport system ATP-binding protein